MFLKIPRLYDSHTHLLATGEFATGLNLHSLKSAADLKNYSLDNPNYLRSDWLMGWGWNESSWQDKTMPTKSLLDALSPHRPAFLIRADGHTSWVNSKALELLGMQSETGLLLEKDHMQAWDRLPSFTGDQQKNHILAACRKYNQAGFTHVRDMTGSESLWQGLSALENSGELSLAVEENFTVHTMNEFEKMLELALYTRKHETKLLRSKGIKLF